jgi:DNA-binding MarR family transcriptional regulator/GNAT superfamily N-acetyltransferase
MDEPQARQPIERVRRFNRFYTKQIGVLHEGLLNSAFSLTEARVIYELAHGRETNATELAAELDLDAGYLSRILCRLHKAGVVEKQRSNRDARQSLLRLSDAGRDAFAILDSRSRSEIGEMLVRLSSKDQNRLVKAMEAIEEVLGASGGDAAPYLLRSHEPGDMGWIVHRHGALYAEAYGWDESFEALVAEIVAAFIKNFDGRNERCWIAEMDGDIVGSVFLVRVSDTVAKLRLLYVEPQVRGHGIGARLVDECIRFAKRRGYGKLILWTNANLHAARHIYEKVGFVCVAEESHHSFGHDLVGENWELSLDSTGQG